MARKCEAVYGAARHPERLVHIGDRESDIYELFSIAQDAKAHFLLRTCVDRLAGEADHTVADEMREVKVRGGHRVEVRDKKGDVSEAVLELRYRRIRVLPPVAKQTLYPALMLTVLHATERDAPKGRERIDWKLVTDLPVRSRKEAIEKTELVCHALEDRDLPQNPEVRIQGRRSPAENGRANRQSDRDFCILSW